MIGLPFIIDEPDSFLNPIAVHANNTYTGLYALDTFSVTDRLTVTAGARFNYAGISLDGGNNALLNGYSSFFHLNPTAGFTYKLTPDINFYAGYAMTNRAPTPLELGCADPNNPCIIDEFLSSDPPLKQVVGQTFEAGLPRAERAQPIVWVRNGASCNGRRGFSARRSTNDILPQQSAANGFGYFANVGTTLRQGAELSAQWTGDRWSAYANYTYIDAVYLSTFLEPSPYNPCDRICRRRRSGVIPIHNGTQIAGIPKNTVKVGVDYAVTDKWHVGADMVAASGQVIFGNENGALPQVPGYAVFGLHTSYQVGKQVQVYGLIQNLFDQQFLYRRRPVRHGFVSQCGAEPDRSTDLRAVEAVRHLWRGADHVVRVNRSHCEKPLCNKPSGQAFVLLRPVIISRSISMKLTTLKTLDACILACGLSSAGDVRDERFACLRGVGAPNPRPRQGWNGRPR